MYRTYRTVSEYISHPDERFTALTDYTFWFLTAIKPVAEETLEGSCPSPNSLPSSPLPKISKYGWPWNPIPQGPGGRELETDLGYSHDPNYSY